MSNTLTPNALRAVKERQQATWSAGEYAVIGTSLQIMGERLCEAAVQIAARHADPRTTAIYDRPRQNFDRHAAYVVVAFVAGGGSRPSNLKRHFGHAASDSRPRVLGAPEPSSIAPRAVVRALPPVTRATPVLEIASMDERLFPDAGWPFRTGIGAGPYSPRLGRGCCEEGSSR